MPPLGSRKSSKFSENPPTTRRLKVRSAVPLQLRWRPLAAAEAGAAASGAAGMPVRWPRRPAVVSEAFVADAEPDTSCAADHERTTKPPIGEVRSLSVVCVCVCGSVGRVWSCGRSFPILVVWGGSPAPASGWLMFSNSPAKEKNLWSLLSCQAANLGSCSCACWHVSSVKYPLVRHVPLSSSSSPWLARDLQSAWRVRTRLVVDYAREVGVRGALFSLFAAVSCFSCLN